MLPLRYKATFPRCPSLSCLSWPRCERTTTHHLPQLPVMSGETVSLSIPLPFVLQQWTRRWWLPTTTSVKTFPRSIFSPPALGLSHLWLFSTLFKAGPCPSAACSCPQIHGAVDVVVGAPAGHGFAGVPPPKKNSEKIRFWEKKKSQKNGISEGYVVRDCSGACLV